MFPKKFSMTPCKVAILFLSELFRILRLERYTVQRKKKKKLSQLNKNSVDMHTVQKTKILLLDNLNIKYLTTDK